MNKVLYLFCIKCIQIKGTISPLEKFTWLATSAGPQVNDIFKLIKEYRLYGDWYDIEELDERSKRILDYVVDKYQYDPGFQELCKGEAYYSALVDYSEYLARNKKSKKLYDTTYPIMDWVLIYREARETMRYHRNPDNLRSEYLKYGIVDAYNEKPVSIEEKKVFAKLSVDSSVPLSVTINFEDKEQLKNFIDKML